MIFLLDVNVLVGMLDPRHTFHSPAHQWFDTTISPSDAWTTCAIVANNGKFATFDRNIPAHGLPGGVDTLEVIPVQTHPVP